MFLWFGKKTKVERVKGGRKERMQCPDCGAMATFNECVVKETVTAYRVLDLVEDEETAFRCSECGELFHLQETLDPAEEARLRREQLVAEQKQAARRAKQQALEAARLRKQQALEAARREAQADRELQRLKKKMGL